MLKVSESYLVSIDISENDEAVIQVVTVERGGNYKCINTITGQEAIDIYTKLTKKEIE